MASAGMTFQDLQYAVQEWHEGKFPNATLDKVERKFAEEAGELVRALNRYIDRSEGKSEEEKDRLFQDVLDETGDVLICLCAIQRFLKRSLHATAHVRFFNDVKHRTWSDEEEPAT